MYRKEIKNSTRHPSSVFHRCSHKLFIYIHNTCKSHKQLYSNLESIRWIINVYNTFLIKRSSYIWFCGFVMILFIIVMKMMKNIIFWWRSCVFSCVRSFSLVASTFLPVCRRLSSPYTSGVAVLFWLPIREKLITVYQCFICSLTIWDALWCYVVDE